MKNFTSLFTHPPLVYLYTPGVKEFPTVLPTVLSLSLYARVVSDVTRKPRLHVSLFSMWIRSTTRDVSFQDLRHKTTRGSRSPFPSDPSVVLLQSTRAVRRGSTRPTFVLIKDGPLEGRETLYLNRRFSPVTDDRIHVI